MPSRCSCHFTARVWFPKHLWDGGPNCQRLVLPSWPVDDRYRQVIRRLRLTEDPRHFVAAQRSWRRLCPLNHPFEPQAIVLSRNVKDQRKDLEERIVWKLEARTYKGVNGLLCPSLQLSQLFVQLSLQIPIWSLWCDIEDILNTEVRHDFKEYGKRTNSCALCLSSSAMISTAIPFTWFSTVSSITTSFAVCFFNVRDSGSKFLFLITGSATLLRNTLIR